LEKLSLYGSDRNRDSSQHSSSQVSSQTPSQPPIQVEAVRHLVPVSTQNSLQLAAAIRTGDTATALDLVMALNQQNEPTLKILATLVNQFRTWLWIKLLMESGERNQTTIAQAAEIRNPKRLYFIQKEIATLTTQQLQQALPLLLQLEFNLKQGADPLAILQTTTIQLCQVFR